MVSTNNKSPKVAVSDAEHQFAHQLLSALQRGWKENEWPRFILNYDKKADIAVVIEMTRHHIRYLLGQAKRETEAPKIITPYGVDGDER